VDDVRRAGVDDVRRAGVDDVRRAGVDHQLGSLRDLHDAFAGPLYVFALRVVGDPQAAEEVVQDTMVRAWLAADRFDPGRGSVATWLFTIARNLTTDHARRVAARPKVVATVDVVDPPVTDDEVDRVLETWQMASALAQLSDEHRAVIVAAYYDGLTVAEIAARLRIPVGTVKSRLFYGLRALRLRLEELGVVT
jgi:RNA polymerase sigma-70 factor (ECF subfamily)